MKCSQGPAALSLLLMCVFSTSTFADEVEVNEPVLIPSYIEGPSFTQSSSKVFATGDLNGDGHIDLVQGLKEGEAFQIAYGGNKKFNVSSSVVCHSVVALTDLGIPDDRLPTLRARRDENQHDYISVDFEDVGEISDAIVVDINNDEKNDIIVSRLNGTSLVFLNMGLNSAPSELVPLPEITDTDTDTVTDACFAILEIGGARYADTPIDSLRVMGPTEDEVASEVAEVVTLAATAEATAVEATAAAEEAEVAAEEASKAEATETSEAAEAAAAAVFEAAEAAEAAAAEAAEAAAAEAAGEESAAQAAAMKATAKAAESVAAATKATEAAKAARVAKFKESAAAAAAVAEASAAAEAAEAAEADAVAAAAEAKAAADAEESDEVVDAADTKAKAASDASEIAIQVAEAAEFAAATAIETSDAAASAASAASTAARSAEVAATAAEAVAVAARSAEEAGTIVEGTEVERIYYFEGTHKTTSIAVGYVNNDNYLDIVTGNDGQTNKLYLNDGTNFPFVKPDKGINISSSTFRTTNIALADIDNDDYLDVVETNTEYYFFNSFTYSINSGVLDQPFFGDVDSGFLSASKVRSAGSVATGDFDQDGDDDIVVGTKSNQDEFYLELFNDNFSTYTELPIKKPFKADIAAISVEDLNNDSYPDLVVSFNDPLEQQDNVTQIYLNDGGDYPFVGTLGITVGTSESEYGSSIALGNLDAGADLDANSRLDIVLATEKMIATLLFDGLKADDTAPEFTISGAVDGALIYAPNSTHNIKINASDESGVASIFVEGFLRNSDGTYNETPFEWNGNFDGLVEGSYMLLDFYTDSLGYKLELTLTDKNGNERTESLAFGFISDPEYADQDADGMFDLWESNFGLDNTNSADGALDKDGDGLTNKEEFELGTKPNRLDTDGDEVNDGDEVANRTDPLHDDLAPVVTIETPVPNAWLLTETPYRLRGNIEEKGGIDSTVILLDGVQVYSINSSYLSYPYTDLSEGEHTFELISTDQAGNVGRTSVSLIVVSDIKKVDSDGDGIPDYWEKLNGLDYKSAADALMDQDGDLVSNIDEFKSGSNPKNPDTDGDGYSDKFEFDRGFDLTKDDRPPVFEELSVLTVNATGLLTEVPLSAKATDGLDGVVAAIASDLGPFESGRHEIIFTATDKANNQATAVQILNILPMADFALEQYIEEGTQGVIEVYLSGDAPSYPVVIKIDIEGTAQQGSDYTLAEQTIVIESGRKGAVVIDILSDGVAEDRETIELSMGPLEDDIAEGEEATESPKKIYFEQATAGTHTKTKLTIIEENIAPTANLYVMQGDRKSRIIVRDQGLASVTAAVLDVNAQDSHSYEWIMSTELSASASGLRSYTASFDPLLVPAGVHSAKVIVTDTGSPQISTTVEVDIKVVDKVDFESRLLDGDDNGIPNEFDRAADAHQLPVREGSGAEHLINTLPGLKLSIGATALSGDSKDAEVILAEIIAYMGAKTTYSATDEKMNVGGYFDFDVSGLPFPGMTVDIVIPLSGNIPADAVYRKFSPQNGWTDFVSDDLNRVSSAPGKGGVCPPAGSRLFVEGLIAFNHCVQLSIEDGGPNDMDGMANGIIRDPGGVAIEPEEEEVEEVEEVSIDSGGGGGGSADWMLLMLMLALCGVRRRIA